jgi:hypothetical protein
MLSRQKPLAALAAVTIAAPTASASAATTAAPTVDPTVCQLPKTTMGPFGPTQPITGGASLANVLTNAGNTVGCAPPAPQPSLLPTTPWLQ